MSQGYLVRAIAILCIGAAMGAGTSATAHSKREPRIYVANKDYPPAPAVHVAVVPFAVPHNHPRWGREAARVARKKFRRQDFDLVPKHDIEAAVAEMSLSPKRLIGDKTLVEIGRKVGADWVVHGRISRLKADSPKFLGIPLPSQRQAQCSLDTRVVEVKTGELICRNFGEAKGEVGSQWSTNSFEARHRIIARAMRRIYEPLFERLPKLSADLYKRRSYVSDDAVYAADDVAVAVLPFADAAGRLKHEILVTNAAREAFEKEGFRVVDPDKVDYALSRLPHDLAEDHTDATLTQLGRALEAGLVVYGEILHLRVENKRIPAVKTDFIVPGRKRASIVLKAKIVDTATGEVVYRSQRRADDPLAGVEFLTETAEVRQRAARQCVRYLFSDFFELCVIE